MSHKRMLISGYLFAFLVIMGMLTSRAGGQIALAPAATNNAPPFSPGKLDFGALHDGQSKKLTLSLTVPAAGNVQMELLKGVFQVTQYREMAIVGLSKNSPRTGPTTGPVRVAKVTIPNPTGPFQVPANSQIELDVVFKPTFPSDPFGSLAPGAQAANLKLSGPGVTRSWAISVPLRGMLQAPEIQAQGIQGQARGGWYQITGSGFHPNEQVRLEVSNLPTSGGKKLLDNLTAGSDGKVSFQYNATVDSTPCTAVPPAVRNTWQVTFTADGKDSRAPASVAAFARGFLIYDCP